MESVDHRISLVKKLLIYHKDIMIARLITNKIIPYILFYDYKGHWPRQSYTLGVLLNTLSYVTVGSTIDVTPRRKKLVLHQKLKLQLMHWSLNTIAHLEYSHHDNLVRLHHLRQLWTHFFFLFFLIIFRLANPHCLLHCLQALESALDNVTNTKDAKVLFHFNDSHSLMQ